MAFPLIGALLGPVTNVINTVLERVLPEDPELRRKAASEVLQVMHSERAAELEASMKVIVAESQGGILARNWRPVVMLFFATMMGMHWMGYTPPNLPEAVVLELMAIIKIGLGGYVVGRSAEKIVPQLAAALKK